MLPPGFLSNDQIHITFDNPDGRHQTINGGQTAHQTTSTIFQVKLDNNNNNNTEYPEKGGIIDEDEEKF